MNSRLGNDELGEVHVRPMAADDYPEVRALWDATPGVGLDASDEEPRIVAYLARNPGLSLVAHDADGLLVAAVLCGHDGRRGYLSHLAVAASHRRRGLGRRLVARCLERLSAERILRCNLRMFVDNHSGAEFWSGIGWRVRDDLVVMTIDTVPAE